MKLYYYDVEGHNYEGWTLIDMLDDADLSYAYNMLGVWEHEGKLYWAEDAGCSCPTPFEDYTNTEDLNALTDAPSYLIFEAAVQDFPADEVDKAEILHTVKTKLNIYQ
jgi:hypothetical protein